MKYSLNNEDNDSEYEPEHKFYSSCGQISRRYAEENDWEGSDPSDVCDCPSESEEEGEEGGEYEEGEE